MSNRTEVRTITKPINDADDFTKIVNAALKDGFVYSPSRVVSNRNGHWLVVELIKTIVE